MILSPPTVETLRLVAAWHRAEARRCRPWEQDDRARHLAEARKRDEEASRLGGPVRAPVGIGDPS